MLLFDDPTVREFGENYAEKITSALQQLFSADKVQLVQDVILKTVGNGLRQLEDRLQKTLNAVSFDTLEAEQLRNLEQLLLYVENYGMQMFRDLLTKDPPIISPNTLLCYDDTVMPTKPTKSKRDLFRETFQTTHDELLENIEPKGLLLDHLAQKNIITSSDEESIASGSGRRGRTRKLLSIMSSASTDQIEKGFLPALKATHPKLAENFVKTYKALEQRPNTPSASETCLPCRIKNEVDLSRIAHVLYTRKSINTTVYEDLCNTSVSNKKKWKIISEKQKTHIAVIEALKTKYKALHQQCQYLHTRDLNCTCPTLKLNAPTQLTTDKWNQDELDSERRYIPEYKRIPTAPRNASTSSVAGLSSISSAIPDQQTAYSHTHYGSNTGPGLEPFQLNRWLDVDSVLSSAPIDLSTSSTLWELNLPPIYQSTRQNTSTSSFAGLSNLSATQASQSMCARRGMKRTVSSATSVAALSDFSEFEQGRSICSDDQIPIGTKRFRHFVDDSDTGND